MNILQAIILGIVQGITEFLPVSSSGHLQLARELLDINIVQSLTFDAALHTGTVCSTILVLRKDIMELFKGVMTTKWNEAHAYIIKLIISMIPIAIVGFYFKDEIEALMSSSQSILVVSYMLILTALLLTFAYYAPRKRGHNVTYRDSFVIGLAQAAAVMPGLSRSGATIATGILLGDGRSRIAKFSFLMVLVPILGNTILDLIKGGGEISILGVPPEALVAGFLSSFAVGTVACRFMLNIVKRGKLVYFAVYCAIVGSLSLIGYLCI